VFAAKPIRHYFTIRLLFLAMRCCSRGEEIKKWTLAKGKRTMMRNYYAVSEKMAAEIDISEP